MRSAQIAIIVVLLLLILSFLPIFLIHNGFDDPVFTFPLLIGLVVLIVIDHRSSKGPTMGNHNSPNARFCSTCGARLPFLTRFCPSCGAEQHG